MTRRTVLAATAGVVAGIVAAGTQEAEAQRRLPEPTAANLPPWRGFNLLEKFMVHDNRPFVEEDFAWIREWGMNYARLPMDYRCWIEGGDWRRFREPTLKEIDAAVAYGERHGVHVCINFHRAPGHTVAQPPEAKSVWTDAEALEVCCLHWSTFARRYKGIPNSHLSFNLFNEPMVIAPEVHRRVVERVAGAIREQDPGRLIMCDGRMWGNAPPEELVGLGVAAATRGYQPTRISHWKASWVYGSDTWAEPVYPLPEGDFVWNRETLRTRQIEPWRRLEERGVGVMVGEFGAYNRTPHRVVMAWLTDCLSLWNEAGWGWAMWNLRGSFGVVDSGRADVTYEDWRGRKLDRALLDLLRRS